MNKKELIEAISKEVDLPKTKVEAVMTSMLDTIKKEVKKENKVALPGFGSFEIKNNKARNGINPATKEAIQIKASKSAKFKVSKTFKDSLN